MVNDVCEYPNSKLDIAENSSTLFERCHVDPWRGRLANINILLQFTVDL